LDIGLQIIERVDELVAVEELQRIVWPGDETEIIPAHLLIAAIQHGGVLVGAYLKEGDHLTSELAGFVFGFPGFYMTADGPRLLHYSHMLAVHPNYRDQGLGFKLKRAQWQMVRKQGIDRIAWTFDPLQSRNANLNIARLGAVCNTYLIDFYGEMTDGLNVGLPSDRLQVDWWVNSQRVNRRLSRQSRKKLDLAHFLSAGAQIINPSRLAEDGHPHPTSPDPQYFEDISTIPVKEMENGNHPALILLEIPENITSLKEENISLAKDWRFHTRDLFTSLFAAGYLITDFVHLAGSSPRSFYVLSHGESTI
jgi:predicted GNAT superfamily acetyltransferase